MTTHWDLISQLGDSRLLLPISATLIGAGLWQRHQWAGRWAIALSAVFLIVLASKLAFLGWGMGIARLDFTGFSGHAAMSALTWPVVLTLIRRKAGSRKWTVAAGLLLAAAVGYSRLPLNTHAWSEVAGGFLLGAGSAAAITSRMDYPLRINREWVVAALLAGACLAIATREAHTHQVVVKLAKKLSGNVKEFKRDILFQKLPRGNDPNSRT